ncbi:hypothetical protein BC777_2440 [Yoonia maricola]|uniref:Tetratricopeptide repeat protein n=1 Tax=Yoonia maricola TaxID=420999 RepID=A0A2M8W586_9RHOB|nr:hypothetical protein [Yoonia maricola]PJI86083.1 hypothetical protein BC777_2440 [Yoonia maricola]
MRLTVLWPFLFMAIATPLKAQSAFERLQQQAEAALVGDRPGQAASIATEMLGAQPESFAALYLLALAQADLDTPQSAAETGAQAYKAALTNDERFLAARFVAGVHFQAGQYTRSQIWLRRAANDAQTQADRQSVAAAFNATSDANPLSVQVTGWIAPSDNINNGSEDGILTLESIGLTFVLPEDRRSLSGVAFAASTELSYRISQSPQQSTALVGLVSGETYTLSSDAQDLLASSPDEEVRAVDGKDFARVTASVGIDRQQNNISPLGPVRFGVTLGSYWQGGTRLINYRDLSVAQIVPIGRRSTARIRGLVRKQEVLTPSLRDSTLYDVLGTFDRTLASGDLLQLSLRARQVAAGSETSFDEYEAGVGYGLAQPILGVRLFTSLAVGMRTYDEFTTTLDGREDNFISADATATFQDINYFGFSPSITLSSSRTVSTAEENTTSAVQLLFGITSRF